MSLPFCCFYQALLDLPRNVKSSNSTFVYLVKLDNRPVSEDNIQDEVSHAIAQNAS